jgi:hypothetical protein
MQPIISGIKQGVPLVDMNSLDLLWKGANSEDPAVIAITAWCLGHARNDSYQKIFESLKLRKPQMTDMAKAFVEIGEARIILQSDNKSAKAAKLKEFDRSNNSYLRIEVAREWKAVDRKRAILEHNNLLNGERAVQPRLRAAVLESIKDLGVEGSSAPTPLADDQYKVVIDILYSN